MRAEGKCVGCELQNIHCSVRCLVLATCCVKLVLYCILMSSDVLVGPNKKRLFEIHSSVCCRACKHYQTEQ